MAPFDGHLRFWHSETATASNKDKMDESKSSASQTACLSTKIWVLLILVTTSLMQCINVSQLLTSVQSYYMADSDQLPVIHTFPGLVQIQNNNDLTLVARLAHNARPLQYVHDRTNKYWVDNDGQNHKHKRIKERKNNCLPLGDWQDDNYMTCLHFHEVHMENLERVGGGGFRDAWLMYEYDGKTKRALKTLRAFHKKRTIEYNHVYTERHRLDAQIMTQLTSSPYIANLYGHCSSSSLVDFADGGNLLGNILKEERPPKRVLMKRARDVAHGLADAHLVDSEGRASVLHGDIKPNQWVWLDGMYKLNDFNLCKALTWNPDEQRYCGKSKGYESRWQAPEQLGDGYVPRSEKADIYSLGSVLYFMLTGKRPFKGNKTAKAIKFMVDGLRPEIPAKIRHSTHPFDISMRRVIRACMAHDPAKRPSAREVANALDEALTILKKLEAKKFNEIKRQDRSRKRSDDKEESRAHSRREKAREKKRKHRSRDKSEDKARSKAHSREKKQEKKRKDRSRDKPAHSRAHSREKAHEKKRKDKSDDKARSRAHSRNKHH